jgi:hypothetical protein
MWTISDRFSTAVQLQLVKPGDIGQQRAQPTPVPQKGHGVHEPDAVIQLGQANHVAATTAPVAVEHVLAGIYQ